MKLILYRVYQVLVALPLLAVLTVLAAIVTIVGCFFGMSRVFGYWPAKIWAMLFCGLSLVRVTVNGRENIDKDTSYVFVANHQGAYDIFSIYGFLNHNFRWMMKVGLRKIPFVGRACAAAGHIFVDNSSPAAVRRTMEKAERTLRGGMSVVVFPEGSRTLTGHMGAFHKGAYQLSMEFGLPVVPVSIDGAYDILRRGDSFPHWGRIRLTIHKPIPAPVDEADRGRVIEASRAAVASALPERFR